MIDAGSMTFSPVATVHSCFREKFGIPRQPGLADIPAIIEFSPPYADAAAFRELQQFSHLWVVFVFHGLGQYNWKPTVRPPRLGGNQRIGVFASRSMFRPNPLGLSVVELDKVEQQGENMLLHVRGGDFLDGTPVLDIKPYLPYVDALPDAVAGYAAVAPAAVMPVSFSARARAQLQQCEITCPALEQMIVAVLQLDPRPAYKKDDGDRQYAVHLHDYDIRWQVVNAQIEVMAIVPYTGKNNNDL